MSQRDITYNLSLMISHNSYNKIKPIIYTNRYLHIDSSISSSVHDIHMGKPTLLGGRKGLKCISNCVNFPFAFIKINLFWMFKAYIKSKKQSRIWIIQNEIELLFRPTHMKSPDPIDLSDIFFAITPKLYSRTHIPTNTY